MPSDSRHHESRYDTYGRTLRPGEQDSGRDRNDRDRDDRGRSNRDRDDHSRNDRGDTSWRGHREPREAMSRDKDESRRPSRRSDSEEDEGRNRGKYRPVGYSSNPYGPIGKFNLYLFKIVKTNIFDDSLNISLAY